MANTYYVVSKIEIHGTVLYAFTRTDHYGKIKNLTSVMSADKTKVMKLIPRDAVQVNVTNNAVDCPEAELVEVWCQEDRKILPVWDLSEP